MAKLIRIGFFREMRHGDPADPSLADARAERPQTHQERILSYLDAGHVAIAAAGPSKDVFDPKKRADPPHYKTDGVYVWPGDLAYYVRTYNARVPLTLVEHMLGNGWTVPPVDVTTVTL
jgi:hypothetical protein